MKTSSSAAGLGAERESQSHLQRAQGVRVHRLLFAHRHGAEIAALLADWSGVGLEGGPYAAG